MKSDFDFSSNIEIETKDLPADWKICQLSDCIELVNGRAYKQSEMLDAGTPLIRIQNLSGGNSWYYSDLKLPEKQYCDNGDLLFAWSATFGPYIWNGSKSIYHYHIWKMILKPTIDKKFAFYLLKDLTEKIKAKSHGGTIVHITKVEMEKFPLTLPPLAEQQRIVARVDALLTHINAARDKLSRVPLIMKKFRQAVLAAACSGRLTEGWRDGNLSSETSDQLIERVTQELQNNSVKNKKNSVVQLTQWNAPEPLEILEIPEHWTWIAVKDVTSLLQYGISVKSDSEEKNGIPILRMGNIQDGSIDLTDLKYIPANTDSISNFIVDPGDILFNRTNSPELVGKSAVYNEKLQTVFASYLVRVRSNNNLILSDYLCWWINSMWGREWARNVRTDGVSQSNINAQKLSMMPVPLPPLAEQHEIARRVGLLFERADAFDQEVTAAGRRCERLTQAVLGKAFTGKL